MNLTKQYPRVLFLLSFWSLSWAGEFYVSSNLKDASRQLNFDTLLPDDVCENEPGVYGECDTSKFPVCDTEKEQICYNRRPMRNKFHIDIRQPYYYIDYRNVMCYPKDWEGCSSCSPGRLCWSESRCILDELTYNCSQWF